jgi:hypothetical protein
MALGLDQRHALRFLREIDGDDEEAAAKTPAAGLLLLSLYPRTLNDTRMRQYHRPFLVVEILHHSRA